MRVNKCAYLVLIIVLFNLTCGALGARILGVFPVASPSHFILGSAYLRALAEAGHDVTLITPHKDKSPPPKNGTFRIVELSGHLEYHQELLGKMDFFSKRPDNALISVFLQIMFSHMFIELTERTINHTNVQNLLKSDETFDIVVVEQMLIDPLKALAHHYNAAQITFVTVGSGHMIDHMVANPSPYAYIPAMTLDLPAKMGFFDRLTNTFVRGMSELILNYYVTPKQDALVKKYFPDAPHMNEINKNVSLVLLNSHPSLNHPVPHVPVMVEIGGYHVNPPKKLPKDLQEYLDNAKEGVVYFSMGSNLKSSLLPVEKRKAILNAFKRLKQKVLWKWEEDMLPDQPSNVKLGKWLPQQDILAHPNIKVFITHGGLLSTTEAVYHGVPVLAIPVFGDQKSNAHLCVQKGAGLSINFHDLDEEQLYYKLTELLENRKYAENAKTGSKILHDRLVSPKETAVYWTEYVLRHKGAPHLRVAGVDLPWHQYLLLDVFAFLLGVLLVGLYILKLLGSILIRKLTGKDKKKKKEKTK